MTIRSAGFSCNLRALSESVVIENRPSDTETVTISGDEANLPARLRWKGAVDQLAAHGLLPPVLTYSLSPTVGGTLSAGGFGAASVAAGAQIDHVRALRVVLANGNVVDCSAGQNAEIFRFALAGMGQIGVIERATMATVPLRPYVRIARRDYPHFAAAEEELRTIQADYFFVESKGDGVTSYAGFSAGVEDVFCNDSLKPREFFQAHSPGVIGEDVVNLWCDYFVDEHGLGPMLKFLDTHTHWAGLDRIHILAIRSPAGETTRAFRPLREYRGSRYFGMGVFYTIPRENRPLLDAARAAQRALLEECLAAGGRPYLCGAHDLDESHLAAIYGEEFRGLEAMQQVLDPAGLFNRPPDPTRLSEA